MPLERNDHNDQPIDIDPDESCVLFELLDGVHAVNLSNPSFGSCASFRGISVRNWTATIRHGFIAAFLALAVVAQTHAQTTWRFRFEKGETIATKIEHVTSVAETVAGKKTDITSKLTIVKRWRVLDVDAQGTATLEQSLASLRNEQTRAGGETLLFDSTDLDKSTPELKGMAKFINVAVATIRVDSIGRVVEIKTGPKDKYDAEPPFAFVLPGQPLHEGQAWLRPFTIVLEPPLGTGEKYQAEQTVKAAKVEGDKALLEMVTTIKNPPEAAGDRVPLLQKEVQGRLVFDVARGRVESVRLAVDRTVENHQGAGSSYRFASTYVEQLLAPSAIVPTAGTR